MTVPVADPGSDRGETLIELLVAILLIGTAVVIILGGLGTTIRVSDVHHKQALAAQHLRAFAEAVQESVADSPSSYVDCAGVAAYTAAYSMADARFVAEVTTVRYWNGTTFAATCTTDQGVQQVSLQIRSVDDRVVERLTVVIRKPCRSQLEFPLDAPCS